MHTLHADHGKEFFADVKKLCKRRKIALKQVARGSRVEKFNQDFQRNFYRLMRMRRGHYNAVEEQALAITNNTRNKYLKMTPTEALEKPDAQLAELYNNAAGRRKGPDRPRGPHPKVGDKGAT